MSEPYWITIARAELRHGVYEVPGRASNERILMYQASVKRWKHNDDAIPWCSSFVNWCIEGGDGAYELLRGSHDFLAGTDSAAARSWLQWGVEISHPPIGAIAVLKRGPDPQPGKDVVDAPGHVTFFAGYASPTEFVGIGGNQSNMVRASIYVSDVLSFRWAA
jgi:uncharacterized protein (TIGR02594 family)